MSNALINLDLSKATGYDGIGPGIFGSCADCLSKHSIIVPIFKSEEKNFVTNYRLISILSNISKILEKIFYDKIISHVSNHISSALKGRSSFQQLLILLNHIINSNTQTDVIYLDIGKAFDSISTENY